MGQLTPRSNENVDLGDLGGLFMETCTRCGAPVTIVGVRPAEVLCPRCAADPARSEPTDGLHHTDEL